MSLRREADPSGLTGASALVNLIKSVDQLSLRNQAKEANADMRPGAQGQ